MYILYIYIYICAQVNKWCSNWVCPSCGFQFVSSTEPENGYLDSTLFKRSSASFACNFKQL